MCIQCHERHTDTYSSIIKILAPEEKVDKIIDLNRDMRVRDTFAEPGHPSQNPAEYLGAKVIKIGAEAIMNRTGAPKEA